MILRTKFKDHGKHVVPVPVSGFIVEYKHMRDFSRIPAPQGETFPDGLGFCDIDGGLEGLHKSSNHNVIEAVTKRLEEGEVVPVLLVTIVADDGVSGRRVIEFTATDTVWLMNDRGETIEGYHPESRHG